MFSKSSWNSLFKNEGNPFAFKRPSRKWSLIKILPIIPTLFQPYITLKNCVVYGLLDSHVIKYEYFFDYLDYISLHLSTKCFVKIVNRYLFGLKTNRKMLSCVAYQSVINTGHVENVIWWMMSIDWKCLPYDCKWEIPNAEPDLRVLVDGFCSKCYNMMAVLSFCSGAKTPSARGIILNDPVSFNRWYV